VTERMAGDAGLWVDGGDASEHAGGGGGNQVHRCGSGLSWEYDGRCSRGPSRARGCRCGRPSNKIWVALGRTGCTGEERVRMGGGEGEGVTRLTIVAAAFPGNLVSVLQGLKSNQAAPVWEAREDANKPLPVPLHPYSSTLLGAGTLQSRRLGSRSRKRKQLPGPHSLAVQAHHLWLHGCGLLWQVKHLYLEFSLTPPLPGGGGGASHF